MQLVGQLLTLAGKILPPFYMWKKFPARPHLVPVFHGTHVVVWVRLIFGPFEVLSSKWLSDCYLPIASNDSDKFIYMK